MQTGMILATVNAKKELYSTTADQFSAIAPNINLGLLGAYLKSKHIPVDVIDSEICGLSIDGLIDIAEKTQPLLLGIVVTGANPSSSTMTMAGVVDFFDKWNRVAPKVRTFVWGPHPTVLPERTLQETRADFVVRGEGYQTIERLFNTCSASGPADDIPGLSYMQGTGGKTRFVHNRPVPLVKNLDALPMVDWEAMNPAKYRAHNWHCFGDIHNRSPYAIIWTSFGCPFKCTFCCINNLFGKRAQRFRSIDSVINEISVLVEQFHVRHLKVLDELFVINARRIEEFCDKLELTGYDLNMWSYARVDTITARLLKRLKKVGMNWISYGFESASPEILHNIKKGVHAGVDDVIRMTKEEGVSICADVMFGLPDDDMDSMKRTYDFLVRHNFEWANMYPMFAYPGTDLYKHIEEPPSWKTYALYGYECVPAGTRFLTPKQVLQFRDEAFERYYGRAAYLDMLQTRFGTDTVEHVREMLKIRLRRRLLETDQR